MLPHCRPGDWSIGSYNLGLERSTVRLHGEPYLTRWIIYVGGRTLRLHKFHRGDDDRAFHDHPWPFWTFPLSSYWERVPVGLGTATTPVEAFRVHYRPAKYQHIVLGHDIRFNRQKQDFDGVTKDPFYTIVVTGKRENAWGFWPEPGKFVPWREWK